MNYDSRSIPNLLEKIRPAIQQQIQSMTVQKPAFGSFQNPNTTPNTNQNQEEAMKKAKELLEVVDSQLQVLLL